MQQSLENNKLLLRRMVEEVLNRKNLAAIPEFVADNYVDHSAPADDPASIEAFVAARIRRNTAFPDWHVVLDDLIAEGDKVVARATGRGTHLGPFMGIAPTGKFVTTTWITIYRILDGKLAEHWINSDNLGLLQQLDAVGPIVLQGPQKTIKPRNG